MFGKAKRRDAEAMESIREQLAAADMHARSVLSAVAQTESRWAKDRDERSRSQLSAERAIESVHSSVVENAADVSHALRHVSEMCALVVERLEADKVERRALTEAITLLAHDKSVPPVVAPSSVLGGRIVANPDSSNGSWSGAGTNGAGTNGAGANGAGTNGSGTNGAGTNGGATNGDIDLVSYEAAERVASSPLVEPAPPAEDAPRTIERFRPFATPPVAPAGEPVQVLEPEVFDAVSVVDPEPVVSPVPVAEPVVPARPFDAFAGLPLLPPKPAPPVEVVHPEVIDVVAAPFVAPAAPVAPEAPVAAPSPTPFAAPVAPAPFAAVAPAPVPTPAPVVSDGLEQQWSESYQLTENNSFRPHGGTRLTPRRSNVRTSSN